MNSSQLVSPDIKTLTSEYPNKLITPSFSTAGINNYTFGNIDQRSQQSFILQQTSPTKRSVDFPLPNNQTIGNFQSFGMNNTMSIVEQNQGLLTGQTNPIINKAMNLILWFYWMIFLMSILHIYFVFDAILEYYELEPVGKPQTLAYSTKDLLMVFIFGGTYAIIVYLVGIYSAYDKSIIAFRVFDVLVILLVAIQIKFLWDYVQEYDQIWYLFIGLSIMNILLLIFSIYVDKTLKEIKDSKEYWKDLMNVSGIKQATIELYHIQSHSLTKASFLGGCMLHMLEFMLSVLG